MLRPDAHRVRQWPTWSPADTSYYNRISGDLRRLLSGKRNRPETYALTLLPMNPSNSLHHRRFFFRKARGILAVLVLLAIVGLVWDLSSGWVADDRLLTAWQNQRTLFLDAVQDYPLTAALAILLVHAMLAMLALPGASLLMLITGAAYGPLAGTLLCLTGCTAGASACMLAARHFLRPLVQRKFGTRLAKIDRRIAADGAAYLFTLRIVPVVPFALANVAAGLSRMKIWTFTWVSFVGMLASTFVYVNAGAEMAHIEAFADLTSPRVLLSVAALVLLPWLLKFVRNVWLRFAVSNA